MKLTLAGELRHWGQTILLIMLGAGLGSNTEAADGHEPSATIPRDLYVGPIVMQEVQLDAVLELLEHWTGKVVLRPQNLPTLTTTLNLPENTTKTEALQAIETTLALNGIAVVPLGERFLKVTPANQARTEAPELIEGSTLDRPASGQPASKLFRLEFLRAAEFLPQLSGLLASGGGQPVVFDKTNAVLVTDSISNLQRVETLLRELDRPNTDLVRPRFYPLQHAKASEVVSKIKAILASPMHGQFNATASYNADDRTNQIVLFAEARHHALFDDLIAKLDADSGQDTRSEIIPLLHAGAKDVATLLVQVVNGQANGTKGADQEVRRTKPMPIEGPVPISENGVLLRDALQQFSAVLTILADERSNALIVSGTADDLTLIKRMVGELDVLLAQVRIEVVIAEVSLSDNSATGISALGLKVEGDKLTGFSGILPGLVVRNGTIARPSEDTPVSGHRDLAAEITMAATPRKSNANILSVPNIITTHNREGKIFVGEERPVISSYLNESSTNSSGGAGYRTTINSKEIGIQLSVKPLIGRDGSVQLEIKQEVNDVLGEVTIDGNPQPRIGRRSTESFISVRSGEIIVLGGLQRRTASRSTSRLGPIPILGDIFGARNKELTRTDLLFFLRPTVLNGTTQDNQTAREHAELLPADSREKVLKLLNR